MVDVSTIASLVVATVTPLLPYLAKAGEVAGKGFVAAIAKSGGEAAWKGAQGVWTHLTEAAETDPKLKGTVDLVAADPADEDSLAMFRKALEARLVRDPSLRDALLAALGGEQKAQEMIARQGSRITGSEQQLEGEGRQVMQALDSSVIENSRQAKR